jgi:hypothetical protein
MPSLTSTANAVLAAGIQNYHPSNSGMPGGQAWAKIIPWAMWTALAMCVLGAIGSGGAMAIGSLGRNPHLAERGRATLLWSAIGAVVVGASITTVNLMFGLG